MLILVLAITVLSPIFNPTGGAGLAQQSDSETPSASVPTIEFEEDDRGLWERWTGYLVDFQRRANAEVATHMNAINSGKDLGAFFLGLGIAFAYGMVHAFGPGHGKFIIMSYFLGRDIQITRGVMMAIQVAVVHVIAAIVIVLLADVVLKAGFGIGLADVPGVRAGSFLIIAGIGIYMLYQATRAALGYIDVSEVGHGHSHGHSHGLSHGHAHSHGHSHAAADGKQEASKVESGLMAFAAGVVPCPGAVLIMLYAIANDMIYPGFVLVAAMSVGIGLTICMLGIGAILARQTATRMVESAGGGAGGVALARHIMNFGGATIVTVIGLVSFVAFLDVPLG
jgi:ABC-type nickel/cobalt efflux system permease component RcnA